jgi:hypothetical protein
VITNYCLALAIGLLHHQRKKVNLFLIWLNGATWWASVADTNESIKMITFLSGTEVNTALPPVTLERLHDPPTRYQPLFFANHMMLSLVKLAKDNGGIISLESKPDERTVFKIELRVSR